MPELLGAQGGVYRNFWGLGVGMSELLGALGGVCRNFWAVRGGYAGTFLGSPGGMPELSASI